MPALWASDGGGTGMAQIVGLVIAGFIVAFFPMALIALVLASLTWHGYDE